MRFFFLVILIIMWPFLLVAQSNRTTIQGRLVDSLTGENLSNASIALFKHSDSVVIRQSISHKNGFVIGKVPAGEFLLRISHIGYRDTTLAITIRKEDSLYHTGTLKLIKSSKELMEVVVRSVIPPVIMKEDTIAFYTAAFQTRPNATVEELLKKLPGVEVDRDGNITVHGQQIQKIFIDGKEFLFTDPKTASQNLLADMVQKVEVFNEKSEKARLTGIKDKDAARVLNLRLKPDKKKGLFGNITGGYASNEAYNLKTNGNYFKGNTYFLATANQSYGNLQGKGPQHSRSTGISINYKDSWNEQLQFTSGITTSDNNALNSITTQRETFFTDSSILQDRLSVTNSNSHRIGVTLKLDYAIDSFSKMELGTGISFSHNENSVTDQSSTLLKKSNLQYLLNTAGNTNLRANQGNNLSFSLKYHRGFRKQGRYLGVNIAKGNRRSKGTTQLASVTRIYDTNGMQTDSLLRNQWSDPSSNNADFKLNINYTEPLGKGQILDFAYSLQQSAADAQRETYNYNPVTGKYDKRDSLTSNSFINKNLAQLFSLGYNYSRKNLQAQLGFSVQLTQQDNNNLSGHRADIQQHFHNIMPRASLLYSFSPQKSLTISYNGSSQPPDIEQLQPVPDYSNPLLIRLGNPALKTMFTNTFDLAYKYFTKNGSQHFTVQTGYSNMINAIASSVKINMQGIQEVQFVNVNGNYNFTSSINYALNFKLHKDPKKGRMNMNILLGYSRDLSLVNNLQNLLQTFTASKSLNVHYSLSDKFFTDLTASFGYNYPIYSIQQGNTGAFMAQNYSCKLSYDLPWGLELASNIDLQLNKAQNNWGTASAAVWNAQLIKRLFTNRKGELKLQANDILNDGMDFQRMVSENYIEVTQTNIVRRLFVLSFLYRFRANKL